MRKTFLLFITAIAIGALGGLGYFTMKSRLESQIAATIARHNANRPNLHVAYEKIEADPLFRGCSILGLRTRITPHETIRMDRVHISHYVDTSEHKSIRLEIDGITSAGAHDEDQIMEGLGYTAPLESRFVLNLDIRDGRFDLRELSLGAPLAGFLMLSASGNGVNMTNLEQRGPYSRTQPDAVLRKAELTYDDDGLFDRLVQAECAEQHRSEYDILSIYKKGILQETAKLKLPGAERLRDALLAFVETPGTLRIRFSLDEDIPIFQLLKQGHRLKQVMDFDATLHRD